MASGALRRRSTTAVGVYAATAFGVGTTIAATRILGSSYAAFAVVFSAVSFFQMLLDLTVDEALIKYGFRYVTAEDWPRLRRLFEVAVAFKVVGGVVALVVIGGLAPFTASIWHQDGLTWPLVVGAFVPLAQSTETLAGCALILRDRLPARAWFLTFGMITRLVGVTLGATQGVLGAMIGLLAGQIASTLAINGAGWRAWRAFPIHESRPLGEDAADLRRFVISSSVATSLTSGRSTLGTWLIGAIAPFWQAAYFRNAQAPLTATAAISAPARLVLLAEQTADYERGHRDRVRRLLKRYIIFSTLVMCVVVPVGWFLMPWAMQIAYGHRFRVHATTAGRIVLVVGALQFISGFSKTLPVSLGRPNLRVVSHGIEVAVFIPLLIVFAHYWGATGGALAMLVSTVVFCVVWAWLLHTLRDALANIAPAEVV
ncbi:MAG TPA: lipopolysaccharide biosynthesis protein [Gaiellaceae bacterium]|nr:lipopolysaccharide biosynthesis protein [Gaiellaceae bacterium]